MRTPLIPLALTLLATSAMAKDRASFRYTPPMDEERPVVVDATVGPQGSDFALRLRFQKPPFGQDCGSRCANATLLLDTDASLQSGMKLPDKAAENGADLAIIVQGTRDLSGSTSDHFVRVKVRRLTNEARTVDEGELITELDSRKDPERIHIEGNTVFLLIDGSNDLPSGRKVRVVYHPPGSKAIQATVPGILSGSANSKVMLFRRGSWGKAQRVGSENK
ncbi:hypothetical protein [Vitiosangium sp. GDMCC 1.1324]|uniref:hypothetical protein n=1 Tax=Vitiosangium sp. (strain GDMCC 1.1324) TaxID=2138576 RepID=UPI000D36EBA7|nr:hypothetical protein [Vitiosangium sp. GDMCC 1.1324]PTL80449.1 hypothetical protein DAT35_27815 [Vitiosangium sp. GDMCC 1.1324]